MGIKKKIAVLERVENLFLSGFYPLLFFALLGIMKTIDGFYLNDFPLLMRTVIFIVGVCFGATLGYVLATVIFKTFFSPVLQEYGKNRQ